MEIPASIRALIDKECRRNSDKDTPITLTRRKRTPYKMLSGDKADQLLKSWYEFHALFSYDLFTTFYSKGKFCKWVRAETFLEDREKGQEAFLKLLADRKFLFLEFNEHLGGAEYPWLSRVVDNPDWYLKSETKDPETKQNAEKVLRLGFVPTQGHRMAYNEMVKHYKELEQSICKRKEHRAMEQGQGALLEQLYQAVSFHIEPFSGEASQLEDKLCELFHEFLAATADRAYVKRYAELAAQPQSNYLPAVHGLLSCAEKPKIAPHLALLFFHMFTQNTTKLARGNLKYYRFSEIRRLSVRPPEQSQEVARRKVEQNIMLFDHLLQIFPPEDPGFEKYLFCQYTRYYGYHHFDIRHCPNGRFSCRQLEQESVDQLAGTFRRHIRYCIPNEIGWLIPSLNNDPMFDSNALAVFLLRDAGYLPVYTRLADKVRRTLNDPREGDKMVLAYQAVCTDQKETIRLLNGWCVEYGLEFMGEGVAAAAPGRLESSRQISSRFVLEYALKEKIYTDAQRNLSEIAQVLFGDLCMDGESFQIF